MNTHCDCGNPSVKYYGPHEPDCAWWEEYEAVEQQIDNGELCSRDGEPCEIVSRHVKYGEDLDGNRGTWIEVQGCIKCGEER